MNADGSGQRRLTLKGAHNLNPAWFPEGKRIAVERGRREREVSNGAAGGSQPCWSPDGRQLAFLRGGNTDIRRGNTDIYVMNANESGARNLTRAAGVAKASLSGRPRRRSRALWQ